MKLKIKNNLILILLSFLKIRLVNCAGIRQPDSDKKPENRGFPYFFFAYYEYL